jgi:thymidylate synthase
MIHVVSETFEHMFRRAVEELHERPEYVCSPRGMEIKECIGAQLVLNDPRHRLLASPARKANYGFAVGEFFWYLRGDDKLEPLLYYNKRMGSFSDDGETIQSAYGERMFGSCGGVSQWDTVVETLLKDNDSRRAIVNINDKHDQYRGAWVGTKDVPCTLSFQFFVRAGKLDMVVSMRSNDVVWGLTNDVFSFTMIQELMLLSLKEAGLEVSLGKYIHFDGSLHLYSTHYEMAEKVCKECNELLPPMEPINSLETLEELSREEVLLRTSSIAAIDEEKYRGAERWLAHQLNLHRQKRDKEHK